MEQKINAGIKVFGVALDKLGMGVVFLAMLIYLFLQFEKMQATQIERMDKMLQEARLERITSLQAIQECCEENR